VAIVKMLVAGSATVLVTLGCYLGLEQVLESTWDSRLSLLGVLVIASLMGLLVYLGAARALRIREVSTALAIVRSKVGH
jgi:hypothetical protein